jgi:hypothetical protein
MKLVTLSPVAAKTIGGLRGSSRRTGMTPRTVIAAGKEGVEILIATAGVKQLTYRQ